MSRSVGSRVGGFSLDNGVRVFRHRNYRLFFVGQLVSMIGTWMQQVAQGWLVLELTNDPFLLGLVTAIQFLPVLVLGLFGGLIADALPKRQTLIATQVVQMTLALGLFALASTGLVELWHILLLAGLLGITNAVEMPTRHSFAVEMVGRDDVPKAVALSSALFNVARILGPAAAGLTIGAFGIPIAFLINGLSFVGVIVAYSRMRDSELYVPPRVSRPTSIGEVRSSLVDGLRYVRRTRIVLLAVVVTGLVSTFGLNFGVVVPALARDVLLADAIGFGFLMAASGIGSLAASLLIAFSGRTRRPMIAIGAIILGVAEVVAAVSHLFPVAFLAMILVGFGAITMTATVNTTIQLHVPDVLRGRVMSVYTTVFVGSTPFGGLIMGALASRFGADIAMAAGGAASALVGLLAWFRLRAMRTAIAQRADEPAVGQTGDADARPR